MKNLLILAYYFPPLGMGGTQRIAKFVKYLPDFGWRPHVVTVKDITYYSKDKTLLKDVRHAQIYRTGSLDPQRLAAKLSRNNGMQQGNSGNRSLSAILMKCLSFFFIPDSKLLWLPFAYSEARKAIATHKIDAILTTSPPHSIHFTGLRLKREMGIPWLADFRDRWSGGSFQTEPTPLHRALNRRWERKILSSADCVTAVSAGLIKHFRAQVSGDEGVFDVITNGYDADDFSELSKFEPSNKFTIVYCGTLSDVAPIDAFLSALHQWASQGSELRSRVVVRLIGCDLRGDLRQQIGELGLGDLVELTGYVPHHAAIDHLQKADLLLYPVSKRATYDFVPGKTFEYIASGKPVLVLGSEIEGIEILRKYAEVRCCAHEDVAGIVRSLSAFYANHDSLRAQNLHPDFDRKNLTERLASILNSIV